MYGDEEEWTGLEVVHNSRARISLSKQHSEIQMLSQSNSFKMNELTPLVTSSPPIKSPMRGRLRPRTAGKQRLVSTIPTSSRESSNSRPSSAKVGLSSTVVDLKTGISKRAANQAIGLYKGAYAEIKEYTNKDTLRRKYISDKVHHEDRGMKLRYIYERYISVHDFTHIIH
jgi:hypothetical protein